MEKIYAMVHHCIVEDNGKTDCFAVNEVKPYYSLTEVLTELQSLFCEIAYSKEEDCNPELQQTVALDYSYDNIYPIVHRITKNKDGFYREDVYEVHALPAKKQES